MTRERSLTYAQANAAINRLAHGFQARGLVKGDRVLVMIPSGIDYILTWQALCKIGSLMVPVNDAYQGRMLANQIADADAVMAIVAPRFLDRWRDVGEDLGELREIVVYPRSDESMAPVGEVAFTDFDDLAVDRSDNPPPAVEYFDPAAILYTSGTTGPSKGVIYGYAQAHATALPLSRLCEPEDVFYMFLPMFHTGLPHVLGTVLISGGALAIREKFSTSEFWADVRHFGATVTLLISTMPAYLMSGSASPSDADHTLRKVFMAPLLKDIDAFKDRFGCKVATLFNMTEASTPLITGFDLTNPASCGRPRPGIAARIVDGNDEPLPPGSVGELVLRSDDPWEFNLGYWRQPEKTAEAWRNQWLHTGDLAMTDADGNFYFKDRLKDAIRRRGENISSYEVEMEVKAHPSVAECAAVAVPSPMGDDEVKVVVTLFADLALTPERLIDFLRPRMPAYMVPRYVEFRDELPKTPTGKIQKMALREVGDEGVWDREQAMPDACKQTGQMRAVTRAGSL